VPAELGAMQGYGPAPMADAEAIAMPRGFDADRILNTFHYRKKNLGMAGVGAAKRGSHSCRGSQYFAKFC
jgi:hypothetical protein